MCDRLKIGDKITTNDDVKRYHKDFFAFENVQ